MTTCFIVMGTGAIGAYVGGRLAAGGGRVVFVARPAMAAALQAGGLEITDLEGYRASVAPERLEIASTPGAAKEMAGAAAVVALLAVKGRDTSEAAAALGAAFPPGLPIVSLQNGVDNVARIAKAAPEATAIAGMVAFNVTMEVKAAGPVSVFRGTSGGVALADHAATRGFLAQWRQSGLEPALHGDMRAVQWGKLLLNLNNPVNALSGLPLVEQLKDADYRRVLAALQGEALTAMKAAGIRPATIGAAPPWAIPTILRLPTFLFTRVAAGMLTIDPKATSSMQEDVKAGKPTEIDDLCGAVSFLGAAHGAPTPVNDAMIRLIGEAQPGARMSGPAMRRAVGV